MRIAITSSGADLDEPTSPIFGRCSVFVFVDPDTAEFEPMENPAHAAPGGAGTQAAQFVAERGAEAVVTGRMGPNALQVLQAAHIPVFLVDGGTVREAAESYRQGQLPLIDRAAPPGHAK
jgi:predicted Fe-Mo cluster-binding NifX family protein